MEELKNVKTYKNGDEIITVRNGELQHLDSYITGGSLSVVSNKY